MRKNFSYLLVIAVAMLLSLPAEAQTVARKAARPTAIRTGLVSKQDLQKAEAAKVKEAKAAFDVVKNEDARAEAMALKEADKTVGTPIPAWNWAAHATPQFVPQSNLTAQTKVYRTLSTSHKVAALDGQKFSGANAPRFAPTTDSHGIITAPDEGESYHYKRAGTSYYPNNNQIYSTDQAGDVEIVETADGTVYIKDIISQYTQATWVKGTKEGNTITVAAGQPVAYNTNYAATLSVCWGNYDESTDDNWNKSTGDITFTIDEEAKTISLVGSNEDLYIGIFWDDDNSFGGFGDYETVWTLDENYTPPSTELVELPEGATVETWYAEGTGSKAVPTDPKVAFVGADVYISGLFSDMPDAWIKGTIEGTTATFESLQYMGQYGGTTDIWALGSNGSAINETFTFTYDADAQTLTLDPGQYLIANAASDKIYYLAYIQTLTLFAEKPAPAQIDALPYSNDFSTADLQRHFTVIDANGDGNTWTADSENGDFTISYADENDDWLVSPAIKLVAGKKYHVAFDSKVQSSYYPETFEVKAATEATAEALAAGVEVLASQTIRNATEQTYENNGFTVSTTGYYHIGIHNTSKDQWQQYVDNFLVEAAPISAPVTLDLTQSGAIDDFGVIDNNDDGKTWAWSASNGIYYSYNEYEDADDYLILPILLEGGKNYSVVVNAADAGGASYWEKFEVLAGKVGTIEGLTTTVIPETEVKTTDRLDYEGSFTTDEAGIYYIAVHATSDADMYQLRLFTLTVEAGAENDAPAAAADFTATAGDEGALEVNIALTAPANAVDGSALTGTEDVMIYRDDALLTTIEGVAPGDAVTYKDTDVEDGMTYTYYAVAANESGNGQKSQKVSVYVGQDELGNVQNFAITESTANTITFAWDEVAGKNGGYVNLANVEYTVYKLVVKSNGYWNYLDFDGVLGTATTTTATFDFPVDEGKSGYQYFGVSAKTTADNETDATAAYTYLIVGAPEELPIEEGFAGSQFNYNWSTNGGAYISTDASDDDGIALKLISEEDNTTIQFVMNKVNLNSAANPTLMFDVRSGNVGSVRIIGSKDGAELSTLATEAVTEDYKTVKVSLQSLLGATRYASVGFEADFVESSYVSSYGSSYGDTLIVDNIKIMDLLEYNLVADITAPKSVVLGKEAPVKITLRNMGENVAEGYTVKLYAGDEEIELDDDFAAIEPFGTKVIEATYAPTIFDEPGTVTLRAEVDYELDLDDDDNIVETDIQVNAPSAIAPESLTAELDGQKAKLEWTVADGEGVQAVVEDFTDYENGADEDGELGDWTLVNANGETKGGIFEDLSLASDGLPNAWQVFNIVSYGGDNSAFAGSDGEVDNNFLISVYNMNEDGYPGNDDWLISPVQPGVAQTLTFDVKAFTDYGPQTYQVLYSTTDKELDSFTLIEEVEDNTDEWQSVSYQLPEGTKYFAIRNITGGDEGFVLAVDNIEYLAAGGEITGFNIYVDEELVATVDGGVLTYLTDELEEGDHKVSVTALYGEVESRPVDAYVTVGPVTAIEQVINVDKLVDIFTVDGKLVRHNANSVKDLKPGVYVIDNQKVSVK